ncbi:tRNA (cytosine(32)/uridine(32)-2'-O)-methyltransferase TrmJ [Chromobacterium sphagni]|uniref:tRNA (cytidine/uridine-2'-O-)-methyltransferase TrmJ n=1 Tax=Chromobacterium sphagni TaxID=1903179 RepID=A0A1S1X0V0_9NEIS|nr:RNA methyltransferase [Chromobacterium sphagni]OHX13020.1 tRNA (cytosine(32)/uridine(32)-2'-O)-methyltransferase TrmJ [Chromobacterium sphagni]
MNKPQVPDFLKNIRIVLARPSHPGNIGSAARAMKTMGLTRLYLVEPKVFPSDEANALASGAVDVLERATVVSSLSEALSDVTVACALTSRRRELTTPLSTPRETTPELVARARDGELVALVFGNETFGLSIEEVEQCNRLVTIPGNPDYFSLNLAMAVQVMTYELFSHTGVGVEYLRADGEAATQGEVEGLCGHLEQAMEEIGYFRRRNSERLMRRMRTLFNRSGLLRDEIDILRGFFKQVQRAADGSLKRDED